MLSFDKRSVHPVGRSLGVVIPFQYCKKHKLKVGQRLNVFTFKRIIIIPNGEFDSLDGLIKDLKEIRKTIRSQEVRK